MTLTAPPRHPGVADATRPHPTRQTSAAPAASRTLISDAELSRGRRGSSTGSCWRRHAAVRAGVPLPAVLDGHRRGEGTGRVRAAGADARPADVRSRRPTRRVGPAADRAVTSLNTAVLRDRRLADPARRRRRRRVRPVQAAPDASARWCSAAMLASLMLPAAALLVPAYLTVVDVPIFAREPAQHAVGAVAARRRQRVQHLRAQAVLRPDPRRSARLGRHRRRGPAAHAVEHRAAAVPPGARRGVDLRRSSAIWKDFLWPLLVLQDPEAQTLSVALSRLSNTSQVPPDRDDGRPGHRQHPDGRRLPDLPAQHHQRPVRRRAEGLTPLPSAATIRRSTSTAAHARSDSLDGKQVPRVHSRQPARGGGTRSSTRSTRAASPTATATASATSPASASRLAIWPTSGSTRSGSAPGTRRRWPTPATTSPTTATSTRSSAPCAEAEALIAEAHAAGIRIIIDIVPNHISDAAPVVPGGAGRRPGVRRERDLFWFRPGRGPDGDEPPNDWVVHFGGTTWTRTADPDGTPGDWYLHLFAPGAARPQLGPPAGARGVRGRPAVLVRPRRRRHPDRLGRAAGARTRRCPRSTRRPRAPVHRPRRGARDLPGWRRIADSYPGDRALIGEVWLPDAQRFANYLRPDELHTAFNFDFLGCPWDPGGCAQCIDDTLRRPRPGRRPRHLGAVQPRRDPARHPVRPGGHLVQLRRQARGRARPTSSSATGRARAAALLCLALPGSAYVYQGEELGLWEVEDIPAELRQDPMWHRSGHTDPGRDGCRVPLPWSGVTSRRSASARAGAAARPWLPQPADWKDRTAQAQTGDPHSMLELYRQALRMRRAEPALGDGAMPLAAVAARRAGVRPRTRASPASSTSPTARRAAARARGRPARQRAARRRPAPARHRGLAAAALI